MSNGRDAAWDVAELGESYPLLLTWLERFASINTDEAVALLNHLDGVRSALDKVLPVLRFTESPAERNFLMGVGLWLRDNDWSLKFCSNNMMHFLLEEGAKCYLSVQSECYYGDDAFYTADFEFSCEGIHVVVEIDGHEFHDRTKEQASNDRCRDRRLTSAGYRVVRFTGSDVYRDPCGCFLEVMEIIQNEHESNTDLEACAKYEGIVAGITAVLNPAEASAQAVGILEGITAPTPKQLPEAQPEATE